MLETVLVPLSLREGNTKIERMSAVLSALGADELVLLHVHPGPLPGRRVQALNARAAALHNQGYRCRAVLRSGSPALTVVKTSGEEHCGLIALPWQRKSWIQRSLVGSVTKDIVRLSDIPVFVYKPTRSASPTDTPLIMYATDFRETDRFALPYLKNLQPSGGELLLFHAGERAPDPAAERRRIAQVQADLDRLAGECREAGHEARILSAVGRPRTAVVRNARRNAVDVVVIGKTDTGGPFSTVLGSTAEAVAYNARCSVLIVPKTRVPAGGVS